ncbi:MAG: NFACT family protein [Pyrinomonadaceae bacterium]|nr:NFACT family protein [Pyrinomonadaceae bacterium]
MNDQIIAEITREIAEAFTGAAAGRVYQLGRTSLVIAFHTRNDAHLYISVAPAEPRIYIIHRATRELEKASLAPTPFALLWRKHLAGAILHRVEKDAHDRIIRFFFDAQSEAGEAQERIVVAQLTGRSANLFLLNEDERIVDALRPLREAVQQIGDRYDAPVASALLKSSPPAPFMRGNFGSFSEAADNYYRKLETDQKFDQRASTIAARLRQETGKRRKLERNLANDLAQHGDAETHKRIGDLLLANIATAERDGSRVRIKDYYAGGEPLIEVEIDENRTLQEEAARRFARYTKAKRAATEIAARIEILREEITEIEERANELTRIVAERDAQALERWREGDGRKRVETQKDKRSKSEERIPGARRFRSSDGYEILVGRAAKDNDHLTFRVARPHDLWFHAADYPGSHVIVRSSSNSSGSASSKRGEIPHRTVLEAAQLAASFSQAKHDAKVSVNYTHRKFLSKPRGAAPGLVRMSNFRTLLVEPREGVERII